MSQCKFAFYFLNTSQVVYPFIYYIDNLYFFCKFLKAKNAIIWFLYDFLFCFVLWVISDFMNAWRLLRATELSTE